jgi:hypothetical protein
MDKEWTKTVAMTCGDLMDILKDQPPDRPVVIEYGTMNEGAPLSAADVGMYSEASGEGQTYLAPEDLEERIAREAPGWHAEDDAAPEGAVRVLVLERGH